MGTGAARSHCSDTPGAQTASEDVWAISVPLPVTQASKHEEGEERSELSLGSSRFCALVASFLHSPGTLGTNDLGV